MDGYGEYYAGHYNVQHNTLRERGRQNDHYHVWDLKNNCMVILCILLDNEKELI